MGHIGLDDLRSILLSERETGRLTAVAPDIFEKGVAELASITKKVYTFEDPFSDDARHSSMKLSQYGRHCRTCLQSGPARFSRSPSCMQKAATTIARKSNG